MTEPTPDNASAGAMLRAAREKQGLHIAALAAAIKVTPRKLDALEHDRWDELPDATFTRALAQTVCRTLKIDPRPVLDRLPAAAIVSFESQDAGLNAPFRDRPGREDPGLAGSALRPMVWAALGLMGAALLVYLLPADWLNRFSAPGPAASLPVAVEPSPAPVSPASAASSTALGGYSPLLAGLQASASVGGAGLTGGLSAPVSTVGGASAAAAAGETVFSAPAAAAGPLVGAATGPVQLRTSEPSWIEVRDSRDNTLLSRMVLPGESVGLDGSLPIRLTIGNAAATTLGFRGQAIDLAPRTRDNVARVELP